MTRRLEHDPEVLDQYRCPKCSLEKKPRVSYHCAWDPPYGLSFTRYQTADAREQEPVHRVVDEWLELYCRRCGASEEMLVVEPHDDIRLALQLDSIMDKT